MLQRRESMPSKSSKLAISLSFSGCGGTVNYLYELSSAYITETCVPADELSRSYDDSALVSVPLLCGFQLIQQRFSRNIDQLALVVGRVTVDAAHELEFFTQRLFVDVAHWAASAKTSAIKRFAIHFLKFCRDGKR